MKATPVTPGAFIADSAPIHRMHLTWFSGENHRGHIGYYISEGKEYQKRRKEYEEFLTGQAMKTEHITQTEFFYMQECMKTLHVIGLDVRGGLFGLCKIWARNTAHTAWPMAFIIVKDPDTARKYVNIGITLGCATPSYPSTLKEAAEKICSNL
jgi:hypothetical protein